MPLTNEELAKLNDACALIESAQTVLGGHELAGVPQIQNLREILNDARNAVSQVIHGRREPFR
jgi:hypothetical protein